MVTWAGRELKFNSFHTEFALASLSQRIMSGREPCRYFLQGKCKFGDRCKFYHPKSGGSGFERQSMKNYDSASMKLNSLTGFLVTPTYRVHV